MSCEFLSKQHSCHLRFEPVQVNPSRLNTLKATGVRCFPLQSKICRVPPPSPPPAESLLNHGRLEGHEDTDIALQVASLLQRIITLAEEVTKIYLSAIHLQSVSNDSPKTPETYALQILHNNHGILPSTDDRGSCE